MKKIAYLDLSSGISGDMFLAGLIDLGGDASVLNEVIDELELNNVHVEIIEKERSGLKGLDLNIKHEDLPHRSVAEIIERIEQSELEDWVKRKSVEAFESLGEVESDIHGVDFDDLELHEVGMVDSILDIVGGVRLVHDIGLDEIYASTVSLGRGSVKCAHGEIPVPVPATEALLEDWSVSFSSKEGELVTPTGAALLKVLAEQRTPPDMKLKNVGVGFGDREMEDPNALRIFLGEQVNIGKPIEEITFYIDDMSPELITGALERVRNESIDVYSLSATGKKGRTGSEIKVLVEKSRTEQVINTILKETSTSGLRINEVRRIAQERKVEEVETEYGSVKVKIFGNRVGPEYESCRKIADKEEIPIKDVYEAAKRNYEKEK